MALAGWARGILLLTLASACAPGLPGADGGQGCPGGCPNGFACAQGRCAPQPCKAEGDCPAGLACLSGSCADLSCDPPCPIEQLCSSEICLPRLPGHCATAADCPAGADCTGGYCSEPGCSPPCASGQVCENDLCLSTGGNRNCSLPYISCAGPNGSYCANLERDSSNCGACGESCSPGEVCSGTGSCAVDCQAPDVMCAVLGSGGRCVDTGADQQNCGGCGLACPAGQSCSNGVCGTTCAAPYQPCGEAAAAYCADETNDPVNCGGCGLACAVGEVCTAGSCEPPCPLPFVVCDFDGGAACTDTTFDPGNCGGCGVVCAAGDYCNAGRCTSPATGVSSSAVGGSSGGTSGAGSTASTGSGGGSSGGTTTSSSASGGGSSAGSSTGSSAGSSTGSSAGSSTGSSAGSSTGSSAGSSTGSATGSGSGSGGSSSTGAALPFSTLSLVAGAVGVAGAQDGTGAFAHFDGPHGLAYDGAGHLYVADAVNDCIRQIDLASSAVTTPVGILQASGTVDGTGSSARFNDPEGVTADGAGHLYVADTFNETIRAVDTTTWGVTTLAGSGATGQIDGVGAAASFDAPKGIAYDGNGNLFITDSQSCLVRQVVIATGAVSTFAGFYPGGTLVNGVGTTASFNAPYSLAFGGSGTLYVADSDDFVLRQIAMATVEVTTFAGTQYVPGSADGTGTAATFELPQGLAYDGAGTLYVADHGAGTIRAVTLATAAVTTALGVAGQNTLVLGAASAARLNQPVNLAVVPGQGLYISDYGENAILLAQ